MTSNKPFRDNKPTVTSYILTEKYIKNKNTFMHDKITFTIKLQFGWAFYTTNNSSSGVKIRLFEPWLYDLKHVQQNTHINSILNDKTTVILRPPFYQSDPHCLSVRYCVYQSDTHCL